MFTAEEYNDIKRTLFRELSRLHGAISAAFDEPARQRALQAEYDRLDATLRKVMQEARS